MTQCRRDPPARGAVGAPHTGVSPGLMCWHLPAPPQILQPPKISRRSASWTALPHVAPPKPSRVPRAPSKAVTRSLRNAPSPSVFPLRSRKLLGFPRRRARGAPKGSGPPEGLRPRGRHVAALFIAAAGAPAARQLLIRFRCAAGFP